MNGGELAVVSEDVDTLSVWGVSALVLVTPRNVSSHRLVRSDDGALTGAREISGDRPVPPPAVMHQTVPLLGSVTVTHPDDGKAVPGGPVIVTVPSLSASPPVALVLKSTV